MPASGIRCTFFIQDDLYGISETHIHSATEINDAINDATALMKARMNLCGVPAVAVGVRLSKEGVFRDSKIIPGGEFVDVNPKEFNYTGPAGLEGPNNSDQPKSCILLRVDSGSIKRKSLYLAGIPDFAIRENPRGPVITLVPQYLSAFNKWKNLLVSKAWGFTARADAAGALAPRAVTGFGTDVASGNLKIVTHSASTPYIAGQKVQTRLFSRSHPGYLSANGIWQIESAATDTPASGDQTYVLRGTSGIAPSTIVNPGQVQLIDYSYFKVADITIVGQTTRKRGNRFLVGVGRKTSRKPISL